jgi:hypothetical protein
MPWPVRAARQFWDRLRGRTQRADADGHVSLSSLLKDAAAIGLELSGRTQIRSGLVSAEFVTFESRPAASPDVT